MRLLPLGSNRRIYRSVGTPLSDNKSGSKCPRRYSDFFGPGVQRFGFPIVGYKNIVSEIIGLFCPGNPTAVTGFVVPIRINSVKSMVRGRSRPKVVQKVVEPKRSLPTLADPYPSPTVVGELSGRGIETTLFHPAPYIVFRRSGLPVAREAVGSQFSVPASARRRMATSERRPRYRQESPAFAEAKPEYAPIRCVTSALNHQPRVIFPGQIFSLGHGVSLLSVFGSIQRSYTTGNTESEVPS